MAIKIPPIQIPQIQIPQVQVPQIQVPQVTTPEVNVPTVEVNVSVPEVSVPQVSAPVVNVPEVSVPEISVPTVNVPEVNVPEIEIPQVSVPQISVPEVNIPEISVPEVNVSIPQINIPNVEVPQINIPQINVPPVNVTPPTSPAASTAPAGSTAPPETTPVSTVFEIPETATVENPEEITVGNLHLKVWYEDIMKTVTEEEVSAFEMNEENFANIEKSGSVNLVESLGNVKPPVGEKFLAVNTGALTGGWQDDSKISKSTAEIKLTIPENAKSVSFYYNVVSEEPMEWVGTIYNDKVTIQLLDENGNVIDTLAKESINASEWTEKVNYNFPGGDNTAYAIGWKKVELGTDKLQALAGQTVTLKITAQDKGDTIYNTSALISDITFVTEVEKEVPTGNKMVWFEATAVGGDVENYQLVLHAANGELPANVGGNPYTVNLAEGEVDREYWTPVAAEELPAKLEVVVPEVVSGGTGGGEGGGGLKIGTLIPIPGVVDYKTSVISTPGGEVEVEIPVLNTVAYLNIVYGELPIELPSGTVEISVPTSVNVIDANAI